MKHVARFRGAGIAVIVVLAAAVFATSASAARTHDFIGTVGATGELQRPTGLAVASATGSLYVADADAEAVRRFTASGAPSPFTAAGNKNVIAGLHVPAESQTPIAVDNSTGAKRGDFYVISGNSVKAFKPTGAPAEFAAQSSYVVGNSINGNTFEEFTEAPGAVAVDSNGAIYIYSRSSGFISVYKPGGEAIAFNPASGTLGLALDPKGPLYVGAPGMESVNRFVPSEYPVTSESSFQPIGIVPLTPRGVATDARNGELFVDLGGEVRELSPLSFAGERPTGNQPVTSFGSDQLAGGTGAAVAVDGSKGVAAGDVYVIAGTTVDRFGPLVKAPDVVARPATAITPQSATLNGTVDPLGEPVVECRFEYGLGSTLDRTAPCAEGETQIGAGNGPVAVHADIAGLEVADYSFRLHAAGPHGSISSATIPLFVGGPPAVEGESAGPLRTEAILHAVLRSGNQAASYHFEYGPTSAYGASTPAGSLARSLDPEAVAIGIVGLTPGTIYHYRVVVSNPNGTVAGPDQTFTTGVLAGAGSCPNEALRVGFSTNLPECRAYEMASPVDKEGGEVARAFAAQAALDGGSVAFLANTAFPGAIANTLYSTYASSRSADGGSWSTVNTDAPTYNEESLIETSNVAYDADLDRGLQVSLRALAPGAVPSAANIYLHDFRSGETQTIGHLPGPKIYKLSTLSDLYVGGSPDWSNLYVQTGEPLTSEVVGTEGNEIYDWSGGHLRLVSRSGEGQTAAPNGVDHPQVAKDGGSLVYISNSNSALYYSEPDGRTTLITHPHTGGPATEAEAHPVGGAAAIDADGGIVWFFSAEGLVSGEPERSEGGQTLYRWERAGDKLAEIIPALPDPSHGPGLTGIVGTSEDGSYVYFGATAPLVEGTTQAPQGDTNIYGWHDGRFEFIGQTEGAIEANPQSGQVLVSPDGRYYAFGSASHLTPDEVPSSTCEGGQPCKDIFVFDFATGKTVCASCDGRGGGQSSVAGSANPAAPVASAREIPAVFDDGAVYFQTTSSLSPQDSNGVEDVYQWRADGTRLISTGTSGAPSIYAGASADQRDVFFKTQQPLVAIDTDTGYDVYDARREGGIAAQNAVATAGSCEGEGCRGPVPPPASRSSAAVPKTGTCRPIDEAVAQARRRVTKLKRVLRHASGRQAGKLRHRIGVQRTKAKQLGKRAGACRRAAR